MRLAIIAAKTLRRRRCRKYFGLPVLRLRHRQLNPSAKPTETPTSNQLQTRTMKGEIAISGAKRIWEMPPAIKPDRIPILKAMNKGAGSVRKLIFGRVGLLRKISLATLPIAMEIAMQGNKMMSSKMGISDLSKRVDKPKSLRNNCPMFHPRRAEVMPARI